MTKGTSSKGKNSRGKTHIVCRRCGRRSYHAAHKHCASCGFGRSPKMRGFVWQNSRKR